MSLYIDLSEFLASLRKTGIERIAGELCKHLEPDSATVVRFESDHYVALPPALIGAIGSYFRDDNESGIADIRRLCAAGNGRPVRLSSQDTVLIPEIFGRERVNFFLAMPERQFQRCRFVVYDLLPLTHPEYFPPPTIMHLYGYFRLLLEATECGFISEDTRDIYYGRLKRTDARGGVVLPLGCDSLGARPKQTVLNRPLEFAVLGTIEPRKNHELILDAFEPLLQQIEGLRLSFIGKMGWVDPEFAQRVRALDADENSGFRFRAVWDDGSILECLARSRATIYVSEAEGYGLPPVESLWAGTPVIASTTIPSLKRLGTEGVRCVEPLTPTNCATPWSTS